MKKTLILVSILMCGVSILCWILYPDKVSSGPYLDSAHGNSSYGVKRNAIGFPSDYTRGLCAHCHEQHASIGGTEPAPNSPAGPDLYLLFYDLWRSPVQSIVFCYACHIGTGSYQSGVLQNYSYSYRRGGDISLTCPSSIRESFQFIQSDGTSQLNCGSSVGSSHRFGDFTLLPGRWGFSNISAAINPCSACHNPHKAKQEFPCSRPSAHTDIYAWDVWGDDSTERMNFYASNNYWAPKRVGGGYEPDGSLTQDGSNMPDYVSLCTDCHNSTNVIFSTRLDRALYRIDWGATGDFHGRRQRIDNGGDFSLTGEFGDLLEPYKVGGSYSRTNYVLSCTDCHEPHGSPNEFLLRKRVNGTQVTISSSALWYNWCQACHFTPQSQSHDIYAPTNCFKGGACHRHCDGSTCSPISLF